MKSQLLSPSAWGGMLLALFVIFASASAPAKLIHLRNQVIPAKAQARSATPAKAATQAQSSVSGLFLIQFHSAPAPEARARLAALGVDLLHYVPEDAFVARCQNVRLDQIQALPEVEWVGEYRPEYKVHPTLRAQAAAGRLAVPSIGVTLLLAPRANPAEVATARQSFHSLQQESPLRAGTVLRGKLNPAQLDALTRSEAVLWIEPARDMKLVDEVASKLVAGDGGPNRLLSQALGYDGSGVTVAVADSGLDNGDAASMHPDLMGRTPAFFYYGQLTDAADEHSHGTHVSGIVAGNGATGETDENGALYGLGVAPGASIVAQRIFDGVGNYEPPPSYERLTRDATRAGAVIGSNSWGDDTQGRYDISAMEFDELVRDADALTLGNQQYILEFSAGNAGPGAQTIGSPAVAKNVIATGAYENDRLDFFIYDQGPDAMADFSSRGPCEDGRIKPDICAPGTWIASLQSASATDEYAWAPISPNYQYQGGTSQAGPHASGAAAVFVQYYRETHTNATPSPALVKAALINSANDVFETGPSPNMDAGWGGIDLTQILDSARTFEFADQAVSLTNTQVFEHRVIIGGTSEPLKVTLAYTDVPGFPGAIPALVNDLDLEVVAPDGRLYRGNQFNEGESIPQATSTDTINNVEAIYLDRPVPGEYLVRVRARNVVQDARQDTVEVDQDFALVISGEVPVPGEGLVVLDRGAYTAPSQIKITLLDTDLAGQPSVAVRARSTTEPAGEAVLLTALGSRGSFTGAIATATGPALADGRLQVAQNNTIEIVYFDASAGTDRFGTALADLQPPTLGSVSATANFGQALIAWSSDKPATSLVYYGTNPALASLTLAAANVELTTAHSVTLDDLAIGRTYYFYVVSTDEAGNTATNTNGGALFSVVLPQTAPVLLVDRYVDDFLGTPSLNGYTAALDQLGVQYDVWDGAQQGAPSLATLKPYRAVIWRVPEFGSPPNAAERLAISNYLQNGGSLLLASMELLSRLEEAGAAAFSRDILQVQSFVADTGVLQITGSAYEPVGNGIDLALDYAVYEELWSDYMGLLEPDLSDTFTPTTNATPILRTETGEIAGLRWPAVGHQAPGRLVYLSFPLDAVPMNGGVNDRVNLLRNILSFLAPGSLGVGTVALDLPAYTLPSVVTVEVGDSHLAGQGTLTLKASSTTQSGGISVMLQETLNQGVFLGTFFVVDATNAPSSGKVRAQSGDLLRVEYLDTNAGAAVTATAVIDTAPPTISNILAEPDYEQATISWETSEDADALVQFGESPLLGRTAYESSLSSAHAVTLPGLAPDRTYYYRVVSRDVAGNTVTDDNHGQLYTFQTLKPLAPPWADDFSTNSAGWSIFSADETQSEWTLGVPDNGQQTSAHSPPNAWGSNLKGVPIDQAETFLISPAIALTGGNVATLRFWHSYDFIPKSEMDIIEYGQLLLITNNDATTPITLDTYSDDATPDWEEAEIDLTPYLGHVVYLVWNYELISFDSFARSGWLIDDVSVTVSTVTPGTIQISNNLWQASYMLSGPMSYKGKGPGLLLTNAPPGQYLLEFADLPYYVTPAPQTNTLLAGGTLLFQGTYTYPDTNQNGISDLWEQLFFGNVSTNRTRLTDTDGDGMSDYAEFLAGTDPNSPAGLPADLRLSIQRQPDNTARLHWPSVAGRAYRLAGSTNGLSWSPASPWVQATSSATSHPLPAPAAGTSYLFRVEVTP